jgi:hypothetical protein
VLEKEITSLRSEAGSIEGLRAKLAAAEAELGRAKGVLASKRVERWRRLAVPAQVLAAVLGVGAVGYMAWLALSSDEDEGVQTAESMSRDAKEGAAHEEMEAPFDTRVPCSVVEVLGARVEAGQACELRVFGSFVHPTRCAASVRCGDITLYGGKERTWFVCPANDVIEAIEDSRGMTESGDPMLRYDPSTGMVRVGDYAPAWSVELTTRSNAL